jgi:Cu-processing system permease protein
VTRAALTVARSTFTDVARSRWLVAYTLFFATTAWALFSFGEEPAQAIVSLLSLALLVIPLVAVVFGMTQFYSARDFVELLLVQPVPRASVWWGQYAGLAGALVLAFVAGVAGPFAWYGLREPADAAPLAGLLAGGVLLTLAFTGLALLICARTENRVKALAAGVVLWLAFAVVWDGLLLVVAVVLEAWPVERLLLALTLLNPLDLARILVLLRLDVAALLGLTGAVFERFLGGVAGSLVALTALGAWVLVPAALALRRWQSRDF